MLKVLQSCMGGDSHRGWDRRSESAEHILAMAAFWGEDAPLAWRMPHGRRAATVRMR